MLGKSKLREQKGHMITNIKKSKETQNKEKCNERREITNKRVESTLVAAVDDMQRSRESGSLYVLRREPGYFNPCATWGSKRRRLRDR